MAPCACAGLNSSSSGDRRARAVRLLAPRRRPRHAVRPRHDVLDMRVQRARQAARNPRREHHVPPGRVTRTSSRVARTACGRAPRRTPRRPTSNEASAYGSACTSATPTPPAGQRVAPARPSPARGRRRSRRRRVARQRSATLPSPAPRRAPARPPHAGQLDEQLRHRLHRAQQRLVPLAVPAGANARARRSSPPRARGPALGRRRAVATGPAHRQPREPAAQAARAAIRAARAGGGGM